MSTIHDVRCWALTYPTYLRIDITLVFNYVINYLQRGSTRLAWIVIHKDDFTTNHILSASFFQGLDESIKDRISLVICATLEELSTFVMQEWQSPPDLLAFVNLAGLFQDVIITELNDAVYSMLAFVALKTTGQTSLIIVTAPDELARGRSSWLKWAEGSIECKLTIAQPYERNQLFSVRIRGGTVDTPALLVRWSVVGRLVLASLVKT